MKMCIRDRDKVYTDFKERQQQFTVSTRSSVSDLSSINEAYSRQKDRKVGLYLSVSSGIIHANFTSQKKGVFGWSRYSTTYHAKVNLRGFEFAQGCLLYTSHIFFCLGLGWRRNK